MRKLNQENFGENIMESEFMDYKIVKHNDMIERKDGFSILQQRAVLLALSQINPDKEKEEVYSKRVSIREIMGKPTDYKIGGKDLQEVKESIEQLAHTAIRVKNSEVQDTVDSWKSVNFISMVEKRNGEEYITIKFNSDAYPYLLNLKNNYTSYLLRHVYDFNNKYSLRVYELCKQYLKIGRREITVKYLKEMLYLDTKKSYKRFADFRRWVIAPTIEEINKHSDIHISIEEKRKGRAVETLIYTIESKKVLSINQGVVGSKEGYVEAIVNKREGVKDKDAYRNSLMRNPQISLDYEKVQNTELKKEQVKKDKQEKKNKEALDRQKKKDYAIYSKEVRDVLLAKATREDKKAYFNYVDQQGSPMHKKSILRLVKAKKENVEPESKDLYMFGTYLLEVNGSELDRRYLDMDVWWEDMQKSIDEEEANKNYLKKVITDLDDIDGDGMLF